MASYNDPKVSNAILQDVPAIRSLIRALATMNPASGNHTDIPTGSIQLVTVEGGLQFNRFSSNSWTQITDRFKIDVEKVGGYKPSTTAVKGTIPVYDSSSKLTGDITGNAETASKLKTPVNIDIGGYISGTAVQFDGSKNITLNVNRIDVNNDSDNVLNGIISKAHGGTGRDDGAASDIILANGSKASDYGQIGTAKNVTGTDLNTLVVSGDYISNVGTVELHYPKNSSDIFRIRVSSQGTYVKQIIHSGSEVWVRDSKDTGASWGAFQCVGASNAVSIVIYISKSGSDSNTGLDMANPVLTINRALAIAKNLAPTNSGTVIEFRVGEGDWGSVSFNRLPYILQIFSYSGDTATEYVDTLPRFTTITSYGSNMKLGSIVCDTIYTPYNGFIYITNQYLRTSCIRSGSRVIVFIEGDNTNSYKIEIASKTSHSNVYQAFQCGSIIHAGNRDIKVIENLTLSSAFLEAGTGCVIRLSSSAITLADGVSVTGKKYTISEGARVSYSNIDSLPGTISGTKSFGAIINGIPYGGGSSDSALMADLSWKKVLLQTGGTLTGSLISRMSALDKEVTPNSNVLTFPYIIKDKNSVDTAYIGVIQETSTSDNILRLGANKGQIDAVFDVRSSGSRASLSTNASLFYLGGNPPDNANNNEVITAAWANKNIGNKLNNYLPKSGGTLTGSINSVVANAILRSSDDSWLEFYGATSYTKGAFLKLYGINSEGGGAFNLVGVSENSNCTLVGTSHGTLTWKNKNIVRSVNGTNADGNGNVTLNITGTKVDNAAHADSVTVACYTATYSISSPSNTATSVYIRTPNFGGSWFIIGHAVIGNSRESSVKTYNVESIAAPNATIISDSVTSNFQNPGWKWIQQHIVCIRLS